MTVLDEGRFSAVLDDVTPDLIRASDGDTVYVGIVLTERTGKNITGAGFKVSVAGYDDPGDWHDPDTLEFPETSQVRLRILVGATGSLQLPPDSYTPWAQVHDGVETVAVRVEDRITLS